MRRLDNDEVLEYGDIVYSSGGKEEYTVTGNAGKLVSQSRYVENGGWVMRPQKIDYEAMIKRLAEIRKAISCAD